VKTFEKKGLFAAICLTVACYFSFLLASSDSIYKISTLVILLCTVFLWLKVAKNYVNSAIEQKLEESKNKESD